MLELEHGECLPRIIGLGQVLLSINRPRGLSQVGALNHEVHRLNRANASLPIEGERVAVTASGEFGAADSETSLISGPEGVGGGFIKLHGDRGLSSVSSIGDFRLT